MTIKGLGVSSVAAALLLIFSICYFDFPRIARASGYISSDVSVGKVVVAQPAILVDLLVKEQEFVAKNQIIGEISFERYSKNGSLEDQEVLLAMEKKRLAATEIASVDASEKLQNALYADRITSLKSQIDFAKSEQRLLEQRLDDLKRQFARMEALVEQGFVSIEAAEIKKGEMLELMTRLSALARSIVMLQTDIDTQKAEIQLNIRKATAQRSQLNREIASLQQEFIENGAKKIKLVAPVAGYITQLSVSIGQVVRPDIPVLTIVPPKSYPEALLYVPSRSIGFVRVGQKVSVRYQAYPHEHYGRHYGKIREIATAALPPHEVQQHIRIDEPVFAVRVQLPEPYLPFGNQKLLLSPGMVLDADIELDRLKLYQWLFEPLYRLGGRI